MKRNPSGINIKSRGFGIVGWLLMVPVALVVLVLLTIGFYEGRKAYWDYQVREMCAKDGGVRILERVRISKTDINFLGRNDGKIAVPVRELAPPNAPVYSESTT